MAPVHFTKEQKPVFANSDLLVTERFRAGLESGTNTSKGKWQFDINWATLRYYLLRPLRIDKTMSNERPQRPQGVSIGNCINPTDGILVRHLSGSVNRAFEFDQEKRKRRSDVRSVGFQRLR
jgi:hypothetical protein